MTGRVDVARMRRHNDRLGVEPGYWLRLAYAWRYRTALHGMTRTELIIAYADEIPRPGIDGLSQVRRYQGRRVINVIEDVAYVSDTR